MVVAVDLTHATEGLAIVCAVVAATSYGLSNVLQQHEAEHFAQSETLKLGFLARLVRRPRWLVGIGADVGGYVFEAVALGIGTLVVVEPIMATSLLASLFFGALINHRVITRFDWIAAGVFATGISVFLTLVGPSAGTDVASVHAWLIAAPLIVAFVLICVALARASSGTRRAVWLGLGAGTLFGTSALLTRAFVHYLSGGIVNWVPHWEPYALAVSSISGLVLAQSAFQTGSLAAAVSAEQIMQALTGVALGIGMLDEHVQIAGPVAGALVIAAVVAMVWGVRALADAEATITDLPPPDVPPPALAES
jgi:hypothetical protein